MNRNKRKVDSVARLGGEEFALVLPDTDRQQAYALAERMRVALEKDFGKRPVKLTMSLGVASHPDHGTSLEELLYAADHGLYAAKALGRNRTVIYSEEADRVLEEAESYID
jgi:diguanylate cyclase (GGDEF)-like protein